LRFFSLKFARKKQRTFRLSSSRDDRNLVKKLLLHASIRNLLALYFSSICRSFANMFHEFLFIRKLKSSCELFLINLSKRSIFPYFYTSYHLKLPCQAFLSTTKLQCCQQNRYQLKRWWKGEARVCLLIEALILSNYGIYNG
jgi:hypothetical protein